jgi:hypothetical protein
MDASMHAPVDQCDKPKIQVSTCRVGFLYEGENYVVHATRHSLHPTTYTAIIVGANLLIALLQPIINLIKYQNSADKLDSQYSRRSFFENFRVPSSLGIDGAL